MRRRHLRLCVAALATGLLLAGCSGDGGDGTAASEPPGSAPTGSRPAGASGDTRSSPSPSPSPSPSVTGLDFTPDAGRAPKTTAQAERLARAIAAKPANWGPGYVRRTPHESDPGFQPVLDADCVWQREPLPASVLATLTRYSELPAQDGKGPIRVSAVVTVHRTVKDADWEMAETLEEAMRCPDQQLRQGERISDVASLGSGYGLGGNYSAEDSLTERGEYYSDELGGPLFYYWIQSRLAQVTVAVVGRGSEGRSEDEVSSAMRQGIVQMLTRAETELEAPE
ncbi:hypothetical protein O1Q96_06645 [Streptomyces sp. Qhu-G9]|uniref:hypothetical protein n=1 Tax=Streptomyces sp. Qhu-G9 TaxID=3452799 RepID=UPI0022AC8C22|nr:hypothetical protein [Streptomyces aurantiacus]WAU79456.1 hypothetical protein O1Q96_06645 [Streptomyces aurantiacus]